MTKNTTAATSETASPFTMLLTEFQKLKARPDTNNFQAFEGLLTVCAQDAALAEPAKTDPQKIKLQTLVQVQRQVLEVIEQLAQQNAQLVATVSALRIRTQRLAMACGVLSMLLVGLACVPLVSAAHALFAAGEEGQLTPGWLQMLQDKNQGNQPK